MPVTLNEAAIARLLNSETGPVGRYVARKAQQVTEVATNNAAGPVIGIESGRLDSGIHFEVQSTPEGVTATVSTNAMSSWKGQPFSYPAFHDQNGRPWLTGALREVFPG